MQEEPLPLRTPTVDILFFPLFDLVAESTHFFLQETADKNFALAIEDLLDNTQGCSFDDVVVAFILSTVLAISDSVCCKIAVVVITEKT